MEPESQGLSALTDAGNCSANDGKAWPETLGEALPGTREQDGSERHREWDLMGAEPKLPPRQRQRPPSASSYPVPLREMNPKGMPKAGQTAPKGKLGKSNRA